jgi:hypothetical protein
VVDALGFPFFQNPANGLGIAEVGSGAEARCLAAADSKHIRARLGAQSFH